MAITFKDEWLEAFYVYDKRHPKIPWTLESALFRKLQMLDAAKQQRDLTAPPGNGFEHLSGTLKGWCSIRVNRQYRLIFRWTGDGAMFIYMDPHAYRA